MAARYTQRALARVVVAWLAEQDYTFNALSVHRSDQGVYEIHMNNMWITNSGSYGGQNLYSADVVAIDPDTAIDARRRPVCRRVANMILEISGDDFRFATDSTWLSRTIPRLPLLCRQVAIQELRERYKIV